MGNEVEKVNGIALASIEKLSGLTDANMEHVSGLDFVGLVQGDTFSTSSATLDTARSRLFGFGVSRDAIIIGGGKNSSGTKLTSCEGYNGSTGATDAVAAIGTATHSLTGCGSESAGLIHGGAT